MSQENVKVVRALFEAWNGQEMDAVREHPAQWEQMRDTWEADDLKMLNHSIDVGDRVAVRFIWRGAGRGPEADLEMTGVHSVRKGRLFYQEFFWDHAEALETLGLSE